MTAADPGTLVTVAVMMSAVAVVATLVPALPAIRVAPARALAAE